MPYAPRMSFGLDPGKIFPRQDMDIKKCKKSAPVDRTAHVMTMMAMSSICALQQVLR